MKNAGQPRHFSSAMAGKIARMPDASALVGAPAKRLRPSFVPHWRKSTGSSRRFSSI
jgi:hypothetical protein